MAMSLIPAGVKLNVRLTCAEVVAALPGVVRNVWGYASWPDHSNRRCIDYMIHTENGGDQVATYHIAHADRLRVRWIIWNGRIWRRQANPNGPARTWTTYSGKDKHRDHVHVEYDQGTFVALVRRVVDRVTRGGARPTLRKPYPRPKTNVVYMDRVKPGVKDSDSIYHVQRALNRVKLQGGVRLPLTGDYGAATQRQVRLFQRQKCRDTPDGDLGPKQTRYLFELARMPHIRVEDES